MLGHKSSANALSSAHAVSTTAATCPSQREMWAVVHGECSHEEAQVIVQHCTECPVCDQAWRIVCERSLEKNGEDGHGPRFETPDQPSVRPPRLEPQPIAAPALDEASPSEVHEQDPQAQAGEQNPWWRSPIVMIMLGAGIASLLWLFA